MSVSNNMYLMFGFFFQVQYPPHTQSAPATSQGWDLSAPFPQGSHQPDWSGLPQRRWPIPQAPMACPQARVKQRPSLGSGPLWTWGTPGHPPHCSPRRVWYHSVNPPEEANLTLNTDSTTNIFIGAAAQAEDERGIAVVLVFRFLYVFSLV